MRRHRTRAFVVARSSRRRSPSPPPRELSADVGVRFLMRLLIAVLFVFVSIMLIGATWGTRTPTPGHWGHPTICHSKYQVICD
jgi:hypothetical protein